MLSFGPFPLSAGFLLLAAGAAVLGTRWAARGHDAPVRRKALQLLLDMPLVGVVAARLAFVLIWWRDYLADPWALLRLGDGGYLPWVGVLAAALYAAWRTWRMRELRRPLLVGTASGVLAWAALAGSVAVMQATVLHVPDVALTSLDGGSVRLSHLRGKPMVVNLWATWCPPCRREMPVLGRAQQQHPGVVFAFVNQGESAAQIERYLAGAALSLQNVLVDPFSSVAEATGTRGYPTTLFFDAEGRVVDTHVGELTRAGLAQKLRRLDAVPTPSNHHEDKQ